MMLVYCFITMVLTKELAKATEECTKHRFKSPFYPSESCKEIYIKNPESHNWPGYYWILDGPRKVYCGMTYAGSSCEDIYINNPETGDKSGYYRINDTEWTYCNMTEIAIGNIFPTCAGEGGGWKRIVNIDISAGDECPSGWRKFTDGGVSFCRVVSDGFYSCSSTKFSTNGKSYKRVCGRARGYHKGYVLGFAAYTNRDQGIDGYYTDGLSITYGNPRQHIWTYATGAYDSRSSFQYNCPCRGGPASPPFVGTNYYCESGAISGTDYSTYFFNDPLWDGSGCIVSTCCDNPTQPWFYRELNGTTKSDIEARICG